MAASRKQKSLSHKSALFVLAACLLLVGMELWREAIARNDVVSHAHEDAASTAKLLLQHAENSIAGAERSVSALAAALESCPTSAWSRSLPEFMRAPKIGGPVALPPPPVGEMDERHPEILLVFDANGSLIAASAPTREDSAEILAPAAFSYHLQSASTGAFFAAPVAIGRGSEVAVSISRRVDDPDGQFAGIVVAQLPQRYFTKFFGELELDAVEDISLQTNRGDAIAWIGDAPQSSPNGYFGAILPEDDSDTPYSMPPATGDKAELTAILASGDYPLAVTVTLKQDAILGSWMVGAQQRFVVTLFALMLLSFLGYRLTDQVERRHRSEEELARKDAEFRLLAEGASDVVERYSLSGERLYISPAIERLTGFTPAERLGKNAFEIIHPEDSNAVREAARRLESGESEQETVSFRAQHRDGREIWLESSFRRTNGNDSVIGVTRDVTARKLVEQQLALMARVDGLTGLGNRRALDAALAREVEDTRRNGRSLSLLLIDVDRFKRFNDDYGHLAGDAALRSIADIVNASARPGLDLAARYGGEEMALLLPGTDLLQARAIGQELCRRVQAIGIPHSRNLPWGVLTVSVGVAAIDNRTPQDLQSGEWLISSADLALYDAKAQGRNQVVVQAAHSTNRLAG